jgi:hypothetical protein
VSVSTEERAEWVVQVPALTFLNGEKDDGRGGWPLYGMEVGEILKSLSCKSRTVERSLVTGVDGEEAVTQLQCTCCQALI